MYIILYKQYYVHIYNILSLYTLYSSLYFTKVNAITLTFSTDTQFIFGYIDYVIYVVICSII